MPKAKDVSKLFFRHRDGQGAYAVGYRYPRSRTKTGRDIYAGLDRRAADQILEKLAAAGAHIERSSHALLDQTEEHR